ncbi:uncharacterized protein [Ambystoma mexicanum]|uniref:uncharacterized protein n=1 Tax=Ambystoma mexicanum TaxID=8296 RepID=UPI0037E75AE9
MRNPSKMEVEIELRGLFRKIRLRDFFGNQAHDNDDDGLHTTLKCKSTFTPTLQMVSDEAAVFEKAVLKDFNSCYSTPYKHSRGRCFNFGRQDWASLQKLKSDTSIIIKQADKGGGIVVMDSIQYDNEILRQLGNSAIYRKLPSDPTESIRAQIAVIAQRALESGAINDKEFRFLTIKGTRTPLIYVLPKIHKDLLNPPGRPIVSSCGSILEPIGQFLDYFLKPLAASTETYLADTTDAIKHLEGFPFNHDSDILMTLDVESLYSNIPQMESLKVMKDFLDLRPGIQVVPTEILIDLLEIALSRNYFRFKSTYYLQVKGTAMGAAFAPNYATLFMWNFENWCILSDINPYRDAIKLYKRYIDDIIIIWDKTKADHLLFLPWLNAMDTNLKFTMSANSTSLPFLDLLIKNSEGHITVDLYRKETDRNTILRFDSFHPESLRKSIPYSQFLRARRNCTKIEDYKIQANIIEDRLHQRGYPKYLLRQARKRARFQHRDILLEKHSREDITKERLVCAITFNTFHHKIKQSIMKHWHLLQLNNPGLAKPIFAFKKGKNLKGWLTKADRSSTGPKSNTVTGLWGGKPIQGHFSCGFCNQCASTVTGTSVVINGKNWNLNHHTTCNTKNVIYGIICPCALTYIGRTSRPIKIRIGEHKSKIRNKIVSAPLVSHFVENNHDLNSLKWCVLEKVYGTDVNNTAVRLAQREQWWMYNTNSYETGLNRQEEWLHCIP